MADVYQMQRRADHAAFTQAMDEGRLELAVTDVEGAVADFAILIAEARTVSDCLTLVKAANRLSLLLQTQIDSASQKADTV